MTKAPAKTPVKAPAKPGAKATAKPPVKAVAKAAAKPPVKAAAKTAPKPNLTVVPQVVASVNAVLEPVQKDFPVTETAVKATPQPTSDDTVKATHVLKLRELVDQVATASGAKKKGLKEVVEATLAALGAALSRGDELNLPPLGKAKVGRQKTMGDGEMLVVKLRRGTSAAGGAKANKKDDQEALAVADD